MSRRTLNYYWIIQPNSRFWLRAARRGEEDEGLTAGFIVSASLLSLPSIKDSISNGF